MADLPSSFALTFGLDWVIDIYLEPLLPVTVHFGCQAKSNLESVLFPSVAEWLRSGISLLHAVLRIMLIEVYRVMSIEM